MGSLLTKILGSNEEKYFGQEKELLQCADILSYFLLLLLVYDCPSRRWYLNSICHGILWPQISGEIIGGNYFRTLTKISVEACAHTLLNPYIWQCSIPVRLYSVLYKQTKLGLSSATTTQTQALSSLLFVTLCIATHILDSVWLVSCLFLTLIEAHFQDSLRFLFLELFCIKVTGIIYLSLCSPAQ